MLFTPIKPMLISTATASFDDPEYAFEPKWDGVRILLHKQGDRIELYTRHGNCVTSALPELREVAANIQAHEAILDCEGVCLKNGRPVFDDINNRLRMSNSLSIQAAMKNQPATLVAFDVLYMNGRDCLREPYTARRERLQDIPSSGERIAPTLSVIGKGTALFKLTAEQGLEGIVAKRIDSRYELNTRSKHILKVKHFHQMDTVILGYRTNPFALVVGAHFETVRNKPIAVIKFGFTMDQKRAFLEVAKGIHLSKSEGIQWIEPVLCCRVQYLERTPSHRLRIASFKGFLFDVRPESCVWDDSQTLVVSG